MGVRSSKLSATIWITPASFCTRPVMATKRPPSTTALFCSKILGQTMALATPVSSSKVMKITPLAEPGRWRTSTSPATLTFGMGRGAARSSQRRMRLAARYLRRKAMGCAFRDRERWR